MMEKLTREEAINKLIDDDIDSIITGNQDGDNSYIYNLLNSGHKGYEEYNLIELKEKLYERFEIEYYIE